MLFPAKSLFAVLALLVTSVSAADDRLTVKVRPPRPTSHLHLSVSESAVETNMTKSCL